MCKAESIKDRRQKVKLYSYWSCWEPGLFRFMGMEKRAQMRDVQKESTGFDDVWNLGDTKQELRNSVSLWQMNELWGKASLNGKWLQKAFGYECAEYWEAVGARDTDVGAICTEVTEAEGRGGWCGGRQQGLSTNSGVCGEQEANTQGDKSCLWS